MQLDLQLWDGTSLRISDRPDAGGRYATSSLQRGLRLAWGRQDLAEEAVGFGVPVLKRGLQTIFPGGVLLDLKSEGTHWQLSARFKLNLVEKISRGGRDHVESPLLYAVKNTLAAAMRHWPAARSPLTAASSGLRQLFNWETTYAEAGFEAGVQVRCRPSAKQGLLVDVDASALPPDVTEVVVMNEQGAGYFGHYSDTSGLDLQGDQIGCWDEVPAPNSGWFDNFPPHSIGFGLGPVQGARLFRGREKIGSRLAWAGFGYSFPPALKKLHYMLRIGKSSYR
jgi:hypothetical protein